MVILPSMAFRPGRAPVPRGAEQVLLEDIESGQWDIDIQSENDSGSSGRSPYLSGYLMTS